MKSLKAGFLFWLMTLMLLPGCRPSGEAPAENLRVLVTTGGHDFAREPFFEMLSGIEGIDYTEAPLPGSAHLLKPGLEERFDVIVMYDMVTSISEQERHDFIELLRRGIGVVSLHHNLGAHRDWPEFVRIIGGRYLFAPEELGGKVRDVSDYFHDQDIDVEVADKSHPVTRGIEDFTIHDEAYKNFYVTETAHVLLTTDHPRSDRKIAWTSNYGSSRVVCLLLGHDAAAWTNPVFPRILHNAIDWAAEGVDHKDEFQR